MRSGSGVGGVSGAVVQRRASDFDPEPVPDPASFWYSEKYILVVREIWSGRLKLGVKRIYYQH